jgi:hypothetical protein
MGTGWQTVADSGRLVLGPHNIDCFVGRRVSETQRGAVTCEHVTLSGLRVGPGAESREPGSEMLVRLGLRDNIDEMQISM